MTSTSQKPPALTIPAALRRLRHRRGLTQEDVARRMGKPASKAQISHWEHDDDNSLTAKQLERYLLAVDASFSDLDTELGRTPPRSPRLVAIAAELDSLGRKPSTR